MDQRPCQITAPHGEHQWNPVVVDPDDDHVFHIFTDLPLTCPGISLGWWDWVAAR